MQAPHGTTHRVYCKLDEIGNSLIHVLLAMFQRDSEIPIIGYNNHVETKPYPAFWFWT